MGLLFLLSVCGSALSFGQTESPYAIRIESPEVVVPVVVLDRTRRVATPTARLELDEEVTGLTTSDFRVFEDGIEQTVNHVALELPHVRDVSDNISHHLEYSFTPQGVWSSPDLWPQSNAGLGVSLLSTYLVSYDPPNSSAGSCHRIQVQVTRKHATVYARDEYCNVNHPLTDPIGGTTLGRRMEEHGNAPAEDQIPLSVQVGSFVGTGDASRLDIAVRFPASALKRRWVRINLYATVAILGTLRDKNGTPVARFSDMASSLPWNFYRGPLPPDREFLKKWEAAAIPSRYETQIDLPPGEYHLQLVITDGEKFGRAELPVHLNGLHRDGLALGDIILCRRFHEVSEGAQAAARAPKLVPLVSGGLEFAPAGNTRFNKYQPLISYFEIYEIGATATVSFRITIVEAKTGDLSIDTGWHTAEAQARSSDRVIPIAAEMTIEKLSPGVYALDIQASDSTGSIALERTTSFTVE